MALDPSIILGGRPAQIEGPLDTYSKALSLKAFMDQNAMNRLKMQEAERGIADEQELRSLARQAGGDKNRLRELLNQSGRFKEAMSIEKSGLELADQRAKTGKTVAETAETQSKTKGMDYDLATKQFTIARQTITGLKNFPGVTPQQVVAEAQKLVASGIADQKTTEQILSSMPSDPSQLRQWLGGVEQQMLTAEQRMTDERARIQQAETARHNRTSEGLTARGQEITRQGQIDANARAVEANRMKSGEAGKLTEVQGNATAFGMRATEAHNALADLEKAGVNDPGRIKQAVEATPFIGGALGAGMNILPGALGGPSDKQQQVEQAQRDFVNAVLRKESGAAISAPEFANAQKQYFPQAGDSKAVIEQKRRNRETTIKALRVQAGPGARVIPELPQSPQQSSGSIGGWSIQKVE